MHPTSDVYGVGKGAALKLLRTSKPFKQQADIFRNQQSTKEEVIAAGETALVLLYKGNILVLQFNKKVVMSKTFVDPQALPPTSSAAKYHSMRVFLQVQQWMGNNELKPEDWGWTHRCTCTVMQEEQHGMLLCMRTVSWCVQQCYEGY